MGVSERAAVILANNLGMLIGASLFGRLSDVAGRRAVFMTTLLLYSLATGATAFVQSHLELAALGESCQWWRLTSRSCRRRRGGGGTWCF
jgi:putative MFS transporter